MLKIIERLIARVKWLTNDEDMLRSHMVYGTCKCWGANIECGASMAQRQDCQAMVTKYRVIESVYNHTKLDEQLEDEAMQRFNSFIDVVEDERFQEHLRSLDS